MRIPLGYGLCSKTSLHVRNASLVRETRQSRFSSPFSVLAVLTS
jgi:hypothetical protein